MRTSTKFVAGFGAVALLAGAVYIGRLTVADPAPEDLLITPRPVERRTLRDVLTVRGEVRRDEVQTINSPVDGKVSSVFVEDGDTIEEGDTIFALDGRAAVAVAGDFAFFRSLDVGSDGPDVLQLERILTAAGYPIKDVDTLFTEETRNALAAWQVERGYGGATPENDETVTVSLSNNSAGYDIGAANTVAYTIVPSVPDVSAPGATRQTPTLVVKPTIEVVSNLDEVDEGGEVIFTFSADVAPSTPLTVDVTIGGDATAGDSPKNGDFLEFDTPIVFPAGETTYEIAVPVFVDQVIEDAEQITVSLDVQFGNDPQYIVGPRSDARVKIRANGDDLVPVLTVKASTQTTGESGSVTFTIRSTVESNRDLDFFVVLGGTATADSDYVAPTEDDFVLAAGDTSTTVQVQIRSDDRVEYDETLTFQLVADPDAPPGDPPYAVGSPGRATVVIQSDDLPEMTIRGGGVIPEGAAASFRIVASSAVTEDTSVNYQVGGTAQQGSDFEVLTGTAIMRAGTSSVTVTIVTIDDDVIFQPSDMLVAQWPARVGKVDVDDGEFVLQGAPVLSLTEPVFTITMTVSPSDRAELEVGQEVEVDLQVGDQVLPGVISELSDSASTGSGGEEQYEGTVSVQGEFDAVDGATVSIDVTLAEAVDVLAVPVAAVVRTARGDEVRVVNAEGTITRVPVVIGLIEGEWVEIVDGLIGDELVVIDIDPSIPQ